MGQYYSFPRDFAHRSQTFLNEFFEVAKEKDIEVTVMLAIASAGFVIAFERLRDKRSLSGNPAQLYPKAWPVFEELLTDRFLGSSQLEVEGDWEVVKACHPDCKPWPDGNLDGMFSIDKTTSMYYVLDLLRNGLAHGNVETFADENDENNEIKTLVFKVWARNYSEFNEAPSKKYNKSKRDFLAVSPADFKSFLSNWLNFLAKLDFSNDTH